MEKVRYMISDAAEMVHVEAHVLRYWEEELELSIPRNEMGHRYYTRENIKEFQRIKELKDQGYQLKAIRMILHTMNAPEEMPQKHVSASAARMGNTYADGFFMGKQDDVSIAAERDEQSHMHQFTAEERMSQFRELMSDIVGHAIAQNNEELSQTIGRDVEERVLKEMNYLMREQDNAQEERFRKLDEAIRGNIKKRVAKKSFQKVEKKPAEISKKQEEKEKKRRLGFSKA